MAITDGLALTDEQRDLGTTLREFFADRVSSQALRASIETEAGYDGAVWGQLASELGLLGLTIPEEHGGLGLGPVEACVVHEELGRSLCPAPFLAAGLATTALLASEDPAAQKQWLPRIAAGECAATVAAAGRRGSWDAAASPVSADKVDGEWQVTGVRAFVPAARTADVVLVPAVTRAGLSLFLVRAGADGFATQTMQGLDLTRQLDRVTFEHTPAVVVGQEVSAEAVLRAVEQSLLLATAAEAAGGIDWCLTTSVDYAKTREQFGRPIGSFQAVAHSTVDMLAHLEFTRAAARYAAAATAQHDSEAPLATRVAVLRAGEAYRTVTEATIHLLGGTGFTWEHDAHLYYRRAWSAQQLAGTPRAHREAIATLAGL